MLKFLVEIDGFDDIIRNILLMRGLLPTNIGKI